MSTAIADAPTPTSTEKAAVPRRKPFWSSERRGYLFSYASIAIPFGMLLLFGIYPFIQGFVKAFYRYNGGNIDRFTGFENFVLIWNDDLFRRSLVQGLIIMAFAVATTTIIPLGVAWMVHHFRSHRVQYVFRILVMVPVVVPMTTNLLVWRHILVADGAFNTALRAIGLDVLAQNWLTNQETALIGIMLVGLPWLAGINCLLFLGGFGNVPIELYESSALDGAKRWRTFTNVELPFVQGQLRIIITLGLIGGLQGYENVMILTGGGPNNSTLVPGLHLYRNAFQFHQFGYASAIAVVIMLITMVMLVSFLFIYRLGARRD